MFNVNSFYTRAALINIIAVLLGVMCEVVVAQGGYGAFPIFVFFCTVGPLVFGVISVTPVTSAVLFNVSIALAIITRAFSMTTNRTGAANFVGVLLAIALLESQLAWLSVKLKQYVMKSEP